METLQNSFHRKPVLLMNSHRFSWLLLPLVALLMMGCDASPPAKPQTKATGNKIASKLATGPQTATTKVAKQQPQQQEPRERPRERPRPRETESDFDFGEFKFQGGSAFQGGSGFQGGSAFSSSGGNESRPGLSSTKVVEGITSLLQDSIDYRPTLAVWVIDESKSARGLVSGVGNSIRQTHAGLKQESDSKKFTTAVCTFGQKIRFPVDPPSPDPMSLPNAIDSLNPDDSGQEMVFTAISEALDKYLRYRTAEGREVLLFLVTDEAGDDQDVIKDLAGRLQSNQIPLYVIGVPAPFGLRAALDSSLEVAGSKTAIRQGPESRHLEHVQLGFWGGMNDFRLMDSGFGPFALEQLCRASEGRYIALRPETGGYSFVGAVNDQWPSSGVWQPDLSAMRKYAPDYVSESDYQALLQNNAACKAVHEAAKLSSVEFTELPQTAFVKRSEAQLTTDVSRAQQFAAKLEQGVNRLYDALQDGESDRGKLTSPRWQAAFDVAMGRACAAKARVDGYNVMLAELKRGKNFSDESHNTWELVTAETTEATSGLRKLGEKAKMYLERVAKEHPGTPWAKLAQREMQTPVGWKWTDR